ncbi:MAG: type secretion system protein TrbG [Acidobacteriota bacterium]|nr:type secretion system protein TrbG [Acidobacteriota bacterium]
MIKRSAPALALVLALSILGSGVAAAQEIAPSTEAPTALLTTAAGTPSSLPATPPPSASAAVPTVPAPADDPDGALASVEAFKTGTRPPVIERPGVTLVPYGYASATLRCAPLRVCAVELARGEQVLHVATGDSERWAVQPAATGTFGATPLLFVKPTACNVTTNLVVTTDRHVYQLLLDSPPCDEAADRGYNPHLPYTPLVRFYHPNEFVETWSRANTRAAEVAAASVPLAGADLEALNFSYTWQPEHRFPWTPAQVFDDGLHCYIHLPSRPKDLEAPVLAALDESGKQTLLNYAVRGDYYVTDRLFHRAVFLLGDRRLVLERHSR